ncbi:MAG: hypothetical protein V7638_4615 [Acidobacteriota bacterium]
MQYKIKIVRDGRGGWVYYREDGKELPFDWDITSDGFEVYLPPSDEWEAFCKQHDAVEFITRRREIVERLAEEVRRQRAKKAKMTIDDRGIAFSYEGDWLHSLVSRVLGV